MEIDSQNVERWNRVEISLNGPQVGNPFLEVSLEADFTFKQREISVRGFYDGNGVYKIRFMPDEPGQWSFMTRSNQGELDNLKGNFTCVEASGTNHGPVRVSNDTHFAFEDGKPFYPFGTTSYVWNHQSEELQKETILTLNESPFNKIRMCVFPKYYEYNTAEPALYPFVGEQKKLYSGTFDFTDWMVKESGFDFERFNPQFFQKLEQQIDILQKLGIEVDLILFHPYDHWGFASMGKENDLRYLKYIIARLGSFRNIWWSMANEYDLMDLAQQKKKDAWDELIQCVVDEDSYQHPISIHNWHNPPVHAVNNSHWYDHTKENISHVSIQHDNLFFVPKWHETYKKPILIDECRYEGNINNGWGNMNGKKMVQQFWEGICRGAYVTHGETYLNENNIVWWSHGGKLIGESPERIRFLRKLIEEGGPKRLSPLGAESSHWEVAAGISDDSYVLIYFGDSQPIFKVFEFLPEGAEFQGDLIDTWNMTITPLEKAVTNQTRIDLPGQPYMALRLIRK